MSLKMVLSRFFQMTVVSALLLGGSLGAYLLVVYRPQAKTAEEQEVDSTFVEVQALNKVMHHAWVQGYGTVRSFQEVQLQPEVKGKVIATSPRLVVGGFFSQNEVLFQIDPRDYVNEVEQQKAMVAKAEYDWQLEKGSQIVAKREWELLGRTMETSEIGKQLALREPQLRERQAALQAARSQEAQARLNWQRTKVQAPFNAVVLEKSVDVGQYVDSGSAVARLVNTDEFHVQVSLPVDQLAWIRLPEANGNGGAQVRVIYDLGHGQSIQKQGQVIGRLADVESKGRLARILVSVKDPLDLTKPIHERQPLLIGAYVQVEIEGPTLDGVFLLSRKNLREGNRVWIRNHQGELEVRQVAILLSMKDSLVVRGDLAGGEDLITSHLPAALPGMKVMASQPKERKPSDSKWVMKQDKDKVAIP